MKLNRIFICLMIFPLLWFSAEQVTGQGGSSGNKPNILIIVADDLGWNDVGYNGSYIKTPNLDRLAGSGIRMDQHYVMATCTPTRVSLMTGKYPSRYGIVAPAYGEVIYRGEPTLASILADDGYATAIAGKWHMGSPPHTPTKYGFESSYGALDGQIDPYTHRYKTGPNSWHRNDKLFVEEGHATDLITDEAIRVIEQEKSDPFFLYVAYTVPHYPLDEPKEWTSQYDHLNLYPSQRQFAAAVTHMDDGIGRIIEALDRTDQREKTLILFTSDNGSQRSWDSDKEYGGAYADRPHLAMGNNFPLRGWKVDLYEGGIRVPAFVNWPGHLQMGPSDYPIHVSDWLPTLCTLIKTKHDLKKLKLDGKNIWPQLTGEAAQGADRQFYWKSPRESAVRDGDWKLIVTRGDQPTEELFNLKDDFREARELSAKHPDKKAELLKLMQVLEKGDGKKR
jgi:arylsulfatase A-like enzyme